MCNEDKRPKARNQTANWFWLNKANAAGSHGDKRKEKSKTFCRKKNEV